MMETGKQKSTVRSGVPASKQLSYNDIVEFLDTHWKTPADKTLKRMKALDAALGSPSKKLPTIMIAGTNGKSLTIDYTCQLLKEEGLTVGSFYAPHILTYNERLGLSGETINNKAFTTVANTVLAAVQELGQDCNSLEILTAIALVYFKESNVDVAILEVSTNTPHDPVTICAPKVMAITRVVSDDEEKTSPILEKEVKDLAALVKKDCWLISADQSKFNLQAMQDTMAETGGNWAMPIRKLAALSYPFEQLHGRCAALAERAAQIFMQQCIATDQTVVSKSLLIIPKGQRGRPTLEAKMQSELNPRRTIEQFWKEATTTLPGRFELLEKEKPSILLDNASNIDAFSNLFLGIRLLHYQRQLKGLVLIIACEDDAIMEPEFLKLARYFFKKTSGQVIFCPVKKATETRSTWDVEKMTNDMKNVKVKARSAADFGEAFEAAKKLVDERNGLVVVTGSAAIVAEFWKYKDIKKL